MSQEHKKEVQFIEAYDAYGDAIFRYCYYRVFDREKARDFVQEAYCRVWKYISKGNKIDNIRALLYKIANNIIIDEVRKKKKHLSLDYLMEKGVSLSADPREKTQDHFMGKDILHIIQSLDEKYRDVILLKYVDDLSTQEISLILGETEDNVYVRISRGFKKVKQILDNENNRKNTIKHNHERRRKI